MSGSIHQISVRGGRSVVAQPQNAFDAEAA
jgi:hypothetical protein